MIERRRLPLTAGLFLLVACSPSAKSADTSATLPVDTVKPAVVSAVADSQAAADSLERSKTVATKTTRPSATKTSQTKSGTARDTTHLGRDSVIRFDPKDPRRQLPPVKKPPL